MRSPGSTRNSVPCPDYADPRRQLENEGMILKKIYPDVLPRTEYPLTTKG